MTQQRPSATFLNDPDYEFNRRLLDRLSDLERRLQSVERQEPGKVISTLSQAAIYAPNIVSLASPSYSLTWDNATGRIYYTALSTGVQFPASQVSSADVNNLDDYEEGTWTPALSAESGQVGSFTYSTQTGQYTKIGRLVSCQFYLTWTAKPSAGTVVRIGGLPFSAATATMTQGWLGYVSGVTFTERGGGTTGTMLSIANNTGAFAVLQVMGSGMTSTDPRINIAQLGTSGALSGGLILYAAT